MVIVHDRYGRRSWADSRALYFARQGMVGFAVDYMGKHLNPRNETKEAGDHAERLLQRGRMQVRLQAALLKLRAMPFVDTDRIALLCMDTGALGCLGLGSKDGIRGLILSEPDLRMPYTVDLPPAATVLLLAQERSSLQLRMLCEKLEERWIAWELHIFGPNLRAISNDTTAPLTHLPSVPFRSWGLSLLFISDVFQD